MKVQIEKLNVYFGKKQILFDVSTEIREKRITAILGPSGCGKSTFLKSLNRILEEEGGQVKGSIRMDGVATCEMDKETLRKNVGLVFQQPVVFPYSIEKNLSYVLNYHFKMSKAECQEKMADHLRSARLYEEVKDSLFMSANRLSGGQQQRLAIARSLCAEPEVLLLDEPCSALDMKNTMAIEEMLIDLRKKYTIGIVTHNLAQAKRIADDIIFMDQGKIIETAPKEKFFDGPESALAKEYLKYM